MPNTPIVGPHPLNPFVAERLGPVCTAAITNLGRPTMIKTDYALFGPSARPGQKPTAYPSLKALAERIHRDRGDDALELRNDRMMVRGSAEPLAVVKVYAHNETSDRWRPLGWAWLRGADRERLAAALAEARTTLEAA